MRIEQLRLDRFGILRDKTFVFKGSAFHVIGGPNGTGKSTIRASLSDLLFGFPHSSPWAIGFEQNQLKLGAVICSNAGQSLNFERSKGRRTTLASADGAPLDEAVLQSFLTGIDRRTFEALYALDAERLREGGDQMLKAQSDVGQTLFAAASGLVALSRVREELKQQLDEIGSLHRAREKPIWRAEQAYQAAATQTQESALRADEWHAAEETLRAAKERLASLSRERGELEASRAALERKLRVLPILGEIDRLREQAAAVAEARELPPAFGERWRAAVETQSAAMEAATRAASAFSRRQAECDALPKSAGRLPAYANAIEALHEQIGGIHSLLEGETKRDRDVRLGAERLTGHAADLGAGADAVERLMISIPSPMTVARVRALVTEHEGLKIGVAASRRAKDDGESALQQDKADLEELGNVQDPAEAMAAWQAARGLSAHRLKADADARKAVAAAERVQTLFARLDHWCGTPENLESARFPGVDAVRAAKVRLDKGARAGLDAAKQVVDLESQIGRNKNDLEDLSSGAAVPTPDAVRSARAERDQSWLAIRHDATAKKPSAFSTLDGYEVLLRAADALIDQRIEGVDLLAQQKRIEIERLRLDQALALARKALDNAVGDQQAEDRAWQDLWAGAGFVSGIETPEIMLAWLGRKDKILEASDARREIATERDQARAIFEQAWAHLRRAGALIGVPVAASNDPEVAEQRINLAVTRSTERWTKAAQLRGTTVRRTKEFQRAEQALSSAEQRLVEWRTRWDAAMPSINLTAESAPEEATTILAIWDLFAKEAGRHAEAQRLLKGIREDLQSHRDAVDAVLETLGAEGVGNLNPGGEWHAWPAALYGALQGANGLAQKIEAAAKNLIDARETAETATEDQSLADAACARLRDGAHLEANEDVLNAIARSDRKRLLAIGIEAEQKKLVEAGEGIAEDDLRSELAAADRDHLREAINLNATDRTRLNTDLEEAIRAREQALRVLEQLEGREGYLAATHAARNQAAQVSTLTQRWMRLTTAGILLDKAVESYRRANEGPLVTRANEIFISIAGHQPPDEFDKLDVDYQKPNDPRLIALRANGVGCRVEQMSEGTRDQLWLALRIAALELRARDAEPMPFLADDLFASSDAVRTEVGIRYLAELARHTQVILFTHHDYVIEAARRIVPDAQIHELKRESLIA
ncbi:MAG TPA: AAA family ATPase [Rhizomicrobium sp.]|jgi:uncharacterized protein YhaN